MIEPEEEPTSAVDAVPPDSPLARIRRQRERTIAQTDELHVHVPRTDDPKIYVAYKPVDPGFVEAAILKRQEEGKKSRQSNRDATVYANADVLVEHCIGVYFLDDAGKEHGLSAEGGDDWPRFDERLAAALGIDATKAVDVCIGLFTTKADLVMHAGELAILSGLDRSAMEARFRGE